MAGWAYEDPSMKTNTAVWGSGGIGSIWRLGYDPERWKMAPDPKTLSTLIRGGNFDYLTNDVAWSSSLPAQTLPASSVPDHQAWLFRQLPMALGGSHREHKAPCAAGKSQARCRHAVRPSAGYGAVNPSRFQGRVRSDLLGIVAAAPSSVQGPIERKRPGPEASGKAAAARNTAAC